MVWIYSEEICKHFLIINNFQCVIVECDIIDNTTYKESHVSLFFLFTASPHLSHPLQSQNHCQTKFLKQADLSIRHSKNCFFALIQQQDIQQYNITLFQSRLKRQEKQEALSYFSSTSILRSIWEWCKWSSQSPKVITNYVSTIIYQGLGVEMISFTQQFPLFMLPQLI